MTFKQKLKYWSSLIGCAFGTALLVTSLVFGTIGLPPSYHQGYARSAAESAYPNFWEGLIGAWVAALGPTGFTLRDISGYNNHGTLTSMEPDTDWVIGGNPRMPGYSLDFDGTNDFISVVHTPVLMPSEAITLTAWVKTVTRDRWLIEKIGADQQDGYRLLGSSASVTQIQIVNGGTTQTSISTTVIDDGVWHRVVGTFDGVNTKIYVDGNFPEDIDSGLVTSIGANTEILQFARRSNTGDIHLGQLNDLRIYNRAWTDREVVLDYRVSLAPFILKPQLFVRAPAVVGGVPCFRLLMGVGC